MRGFAADAVFVIRSLSAETEEARHAFVRFAEVERSGLDAAGFEAERFHRISPELSSCVGMLDDAFQPGSNYLQLLSDYSKTELTNRNIGFEAGFQQGADPTPVNYKNWNLSNEGFFVITFDSGQVAAYAAGPQIITIAFSDLGQVINAQGPLAPFLSQ